MGANHPLIRHPQMANMTYSEKLKDPRWQRFRLEIFQRDDFKCTRCRSGVRSLHVHHERYIKGCDPWQYDPADVVTLCEVCHRIMHQKIAPIDTERKYEHLLIYEEERSFLTATQTHIDILMASLRKGVPSEVEDEILKNIVYLQDKRREYKNG